MKDLEARSSTAFPEGAAHWNFTDFVGQDSKFVGWTSNSLDQDSSYVGPESILGAARTDSRCSQAFPDAPRSYQKQSGARKAIFNRFWRPWGRPGARTRGKAKARGMVKAGYKGKGPGQVGKNTHARRCAKHGRGDHQYFFRSSVYLIG